MRTNTAIGALVVSGLAMPAVAQVSGVSLTFEADVPDLIDVNTGDPLGNEAFVVQGGTELLPFSGSAAGGFNDIIASMSLAAELTADGMFAGSGANGASEFFIKGGNARSVTTIDFTVTGSVAFEFDYNASFSNDGGWYAAFLSGPGGTVFSSAPLFPGDNSESFMGVLPAGEYQLITRATSNGDISYNFSFVPTPSSALVLGFAGVLGARRRR